MNVSRVRSAAVRLQNLTSIKNFVAVRSSHLYSSVSDGKICLNSFKEVEIPVPWGHVSGKWWGRRDVTPILALHGFEDNAGSFDRLAPLLNVPAFLALDTPGHGKSSHVPRGMVYTYVDFIIALRRIIKQYGWQKVSIVGHSHGSSIGHIYSSLYPADVDKLVSLDCARTLMATLGNKGITGLILLRKQIENCLKADDKITREPPAYEMKDMVDAFCKGTFDSVEKEHAHFLLERGAIAHPSKPNHFYFTRDPKLRFSEFNRPSIHMLKECAENVKCHVLTILSTKGHANVISGQLGDTSFFQLEELIKKSAASYSRHDVEGSHHVHLNNPEEVALLINKFLT